MARIHETVAGLLSSRLAATRRSRDEIARAAGLTDALQLEAIAGGQQPLPLDKASVLAKALGLEPVGFLALCLQEYQPALWPVLEPLLDVAVTTDERRLLACLRTFVGVPFIACMDEESKGQLDDLCKSMRTRHSQVLTLQ